MRIKPCLILFILASVACGAEFKDAIVTGSFTLDAASVSGTRLAITSGRKLTVSNTLTLAGTDGSTLNIGAGGTLGTSAFITLGSNVASWLASPTFSNLSGAVTGDTIAGSASTNTFTNKTLDANATGNVFKWIEEIHLPTPQVDGAGVVIDGLTTSATYGRPIFSGSLDKATNYACYRFTVPFDLDTGTDLSASIKFRLNGADTGKHAYIVSMAEVADSAVQDSPTFSNAVTLYFTGDASGAIGDVETVAYTTLTNWKSSLTPGRLVVVRLERDGDDGTNDTSTVSSAIIDFTIKVGHSQ